MIPLSSDDTVAQRFDDRSSIIRLKCARFGSWRTLRADLSGLLGHISSESVLRRQYASSEILVRSFKSSGNPPSPFPVHFFPIGRGACVTFQSRQSDIHTHLTQLLASCAEIRQEPAFETVSRLSLLFFFHFSCHISCEQPSATV